MSTVHRYPSTMAILKIVVWTSKLISAIAGSPTITAGAGAPTASEPKGSFYLRTDGASASQVVYVATDAVGTWVALTAAALATALQTAGGQTYVIDALASATGEAIVKIKAAVANAFEFKDTAGGVSYLKFVTASGWMTRGVPIVPAATADLIADPGNAGAIPVTRSGVCALTTGAADTRTLADPTFVGQDLTVIVDVDGGTVIITSASAFNTTGNNTITMATVGMLVVLKAIQIGGAKKWRLIGSDGTPVLSTV